jgi:hypothetical protein
MVAPGLYNQLTDHLNSAAILGGANSAILMSRQFVIVLRILAVGSALTILACQIVNRQKQAGAATGDRGTPGPEATEAGREWAASSKSARALSPREIRAVREQTASQQTLTLPEPTSVVQSPPPLVPAPAPMRPAPDRVRGFGSKSAPAILPSDVRKMKQSLQSEN